MSDLRLDDFFFDNSVIKSDIKDLSFKGLTDGKHIRSRLLYLTGQFFDLSDEDCLKLGRIVEMVHNATLTHDDVIDNSHTRRGHPSIPNLINNKKSVLLGDYMLARALHELSDYQMPKLTQELTHTLKELVEGEWIQYENTNPYKITLNLYCTLALKKTGSLFRWGFVAPLHLTNANEKVYRLFEEFGEKLGIIFQMSDDIIDFNKLSQKTYGLDFKNNNINFVLLFLGKAHPELAQKFLQLDDISELNAEEETLLEESIVTAKAKMKEYLDRCHEIAGELKKELNLGENSAPFIEVCTLLDLITDRVF